MKILMLNKYHYLKGGSERYYLELTRLLESHGHTVIPFSMQSERNLPSPYEDYFVPNVEYTGALSPGRRIAVALRTIDYPRARRNMERLIADTRPDVVHAHNVYHQLSYAPLRAARRRGLPVVLTAHDYKLVCPNNSFLSDYAVCEKCGGRSFYRAFLQRCAKGRLADSFVLMCEAYFNRRLFDVMRCIDRVITPSRFMRDKFVEHGLPPDRIVHHVNTLDLEAYAPRFGGDGYALYLGRLAREKGVATLLRAIRRAPGVPVKILGEGEQKDELLRLVAEERIADVAFLGHRSGPELLDTIRAASFVVVPSECYENCPYAVLESFALGKPVVGARIGGIPELIEDGANGYLFAPANAEDLADKIRALASDEERVRAFGRAARAKVEREFDPQDHYRFILGVYEDLLNRRRRRPRRLLPLCFL